ncbi:hypothetical protein P4O66_000516 [Electrophorus voltai]|uniref:Striatin N-terminal domain-containing protein n=1 Tax=Electrophorus voltai TaxID=2609070 RepID=A0AAD8ZH81_9TELE|nr:hypothetical protein P4O66_000516 [Electrophorus voltai]
MVRNHADIVTSQVSRRQRGAIRRSVVPVWASGSHIPGLAMDEQAGPGVFFNNNNNAVLPGGVKAPQPGDVGGGEAARAQYSIPGILHFLQHEWARFEVERAQWEVERAELQGIGCFEGAFTSRAFQALKSLAPWLWLVIGKDFGQREPARLLSRPALGRTQTYGRLIAGRCSAASPSHAVAVRSAGENKHTHSGSKLRTLTLATALPPTLGRTLRESRADNRVSQMDLVMYGLLLAIATVHLGAKSVRSDRKVGWVQAIMLHTRPLSGSLGGASGHGQAQIAFLQGERKGQENLKKDLVRRIKMLEYALKQERAKYHKLKYGTELQQGDMKPPSYDSDDGNENEALPEPPNSQLSWKQGRQLLRHEPYAEPVTPSSYVYMVLRSLQNLVQVPMRFFSYRAAGQEQRELCAGEVPGWPLHGEAFTRYLQEVGYTDTILDVKSQRVKALLGLAGDSGGQSGGEHRLEPMVNGTEPSSLKTTTTTTTTTMMGKPETSDSATVLEAFKFIESAAAEFSDEDDDEDSEERDKTIIDLATMVRKKVSGSPSSSSDLSDDPDTEEALKGFDFLASSEDMEASPESPSTGDAVDWGKPCPHTTDWGKPHLYSKDWGKPCPHTTDWGKPHLYSKDWGKPCPHTTDWGKPHLYSKDWDKEEHSPMSEAWEVDQGLISKLKEQYRKERKGKKGVKRPNRSKLQDMLANLRDAEDLPSMQPSVAPPARPSLPRLNEHDLTRADEVEALTFPPSSGKSFIMGADEALETELGLGELAGLTVANEAESLAYDITNNKDVLRKTWNPKFTLRSHFDSIRGLAFHPVEPVLVTASEDHTLKMWNLQKTAPAKNSAHHRLLSCSADGTVRLWNAADTSPALAVFNEDKDLGIPSSVDLVCSEPAHMVTAFCNGRSAVYNMETQQQVLELESQDAGEPDAPRHINKVLSHPTLPITITAQEDRHIRFYDNNTGKLIHSMVAHLDAVTSLAVDPNGLYLMSGSHDCSIRLWNMESKTCIQEFTAHRKKFEESIHDVAFHPTKCYIGSAGADALAKVFV